MSENLTDVTEDEMSESWKSLSPTAKKRTRELLEETRDGAVELEIKAIRGGMDPNGMFAKLFKEHAGQGHERAQEAVDELGIEMAAAEQNPQANAVGRSDPYDRGKPLEERMAKHNAFGPGNENSPYDDNPTSPSTNAAGGDVAPASSGSFADYNMAANADSARTVRLVDDPSKGEAVHMFDSSKPGAVREASAAGAEEVRIVDLGEHPERAVDADPIYIAERESTAGSFASHNSRPETSLIAVNPEKLP